MSTTDHAFIRAYSARRGANFDRHAAGPTGLPPGVSLNETFVAPAALSYSEIVVPSPHLENWASGNPPATHMSKSGANLRFDPPARMAPHPPLAPPHVRTFTLGSVGPDRSHLRVDANEQGIVPGPHARFSTGGREAASQTDFVPQQDVALNPSEATRHRIDSVEPVEISPPVARMEFHADWEVDAFQWPDMCHRLQIESASGLSGLLRSVLHRAWRGMNVFALTSFSRGEGNTTVTLCLAKLAALFDVKVAIVDGQHSNPRLADELGIAAEYGWNDLDVARPLSEIAIRSLEDQIVIFPMRLAEGERGPGPVQHLASDLVADLANSFELVLIDAGPIFQAAHLWLADSMTSRVHGGIVVRNMRQTTVPQLDDVCLRLQHAGVRDVLLVENFQPISEASPHV